MVQIMRPEIWHDEYDANLRKLKLYNYDIEVNSSERLSHIVKRDFLMYSFYRQANKTLFLTSIL